MRYLKTPEITTPHRGDQTIYHKAKTLVADDIGQLDILANDFFENLAQLADYTPQIINISYDNGVIPADPPNKAKMQHYMNIHYILIGS